MFQIRSAVNVTIPIENAYKIGYAILKSDCINKHYTIRSFQILDPYYDFLPNWSNIKHQIVCQKA